MKKIHGEAKVRISPRSWPEILTRLGHIGNVEVLIKKEHQEKNPREAYVRFVVKSNPTIHHSCQILTILYDPGNLIAVFTFAVEHVEVDAMTFFRLEHL